MAKKTHLKIITPTRVFFDDDVDMVIMRAGTGDLGILPGHAPLTTTISYGVLTAHIDQKEYKASVMGGFAEILPDTVTIVTDAAEWPDEIDVERANRAKERAEKRISEHADGVDSLRAEVALRKALVRIEVTSYKLDEHSRPIKMEHV